MSRLRRINWGLVTTSLVVAAVLGSIVYQQITQRREQPAIIEVSQDYAIALLNVTVAPAELHEAYDPEAADPEAQLRSTDIWDERRQAVAEELRPWFADDTYLGYRMKRLENAWVTQILDGADPEAGEFTIDETWNERFAFVDDFVTLDAQWVFSASELKDFGWSYETQFQLQKTNGNWRVISDSVELMMGGNY